MLKSGEGRWRSHEIWERISCFRSQYCPHLLCELEPMSYLVWTLVSILKIRADLESLLELLVHGPKSKVAPSPDLHQCCRIGRIWHVSRKDSFRYCGEHFLLKTSLEAKPSSAPSPGIMKWHSYSPILWEYFRPSQIVQGFPIHSSLAPVPPGFLSCLVSVWPLSFSRKETPLAHFGISFMWVSTSPSFLQAFPSAPPTKTSGSRGTWRGHCCWGQGRSGGPMGIQHFPGPLPSATPCTLIYETKGAAVLSLELGILCDLFPSQCLTWWDVDLPRGWARVYQPIKDVIKRILCSHMHLNFLLEAWESLPCYLPLHKVKIGSLF